MNSRQSDKSWPYRYKSFQDSLRKAAEKWFRDRGCETHPKRRYCLARHDLWPRNIICADVADYICQEHHRKDSFPLHKYLHHGLSSQAMVFNLIGPLIVRKDLGPLKLAIEELNIEWPGEVVEAVFEYYDRSVFKEDKGQPTSIDVFLEGTCNIFIEAKLVEREFGGCSVFTRRKCECEGKNPYPNMLDKCYLYNIGRLYWQQLKKLGFSDKTLVNGDRCPFASYYQFFRETMFAFANQGAFILLHDARNPAFLRSKSMNDGTEDSGLWPFLREAIPQDRRHQVGNLTIQAVVEAIQKSGGHEDWIGVFKEKYGLQ